MYERTYVQGLPSSHTDPALLPYDHDILGPRPLLSTLNSYTSTGFIENWNADAGRIHSPLSLSMEWEQSESGILKRASIDTSQVRCHRSSLSPVGVSVAARVTCHTSTLKTRSPSFYLLLTFSPPRWAISKKSWWLWQIRIRGIEPRDATILTIMPYPTLDE